MRGAPEGIRSGSEEGMDARRFGFIIGVIALIFGRQWPWDTDGIPRR
jgi:hypothetical protein